MKHTALLIALAAVLTLTGCKRHEAESAAALPVAKVRVAEARLLDEPRRIELPGTVRAAESAQLAPKIMGAIESMPVTLGQHVKKGDMLAKIAAKEINAKLAQAQAGLKQATRDLERERALLAKEASTAELVHNLEDRLRMAQATADEAHAMFSYTTINAPFDGTIVGKFANEGDLAAPGRPLLALENPARLRVEADVPESLARIMIGAAVPVQIGEEVSGQLAEIAPASDATTRTFTVKIDLPADTFAHAGQFVKIAWPGAKSARLVVPETAVSLFGQMERVFVADNTGHAGLRLVKTGVRRGGMVEILAGLSAGERVIVEGAETLREGQPVEAQP